MTALVDRAAAERGHLYGFLSTVFRRPLDAQQLAHLRAPEMLAALSAAGADPGADFAEGESAALLDRLAIDYTQLFHGPAGHIAPYESIQIGKGGELLGAAAAEVRRFMGEVGFVVAPESGELPDHISVELALMADLARREAEALATGDESTADFAASVQRRFLAEHLGRWAEHLAGKVKSNATTSFYTAMAELLASFLHAECEAEAA